MFNKKIPNIINYLTVLYAFLLPLSRASIVLFTTLIMLLWIIEGGFKEKFKQIFKYKFTLLVFIFLIMNIIALLWVEPQNIEQALIYIKKYWYMFIIFPIITSLKKEFIKKSIYAFLSGMTISMIISYGIYFEVLDLKEVTKDSLSPFMYHVMYSVFLAFSMLLSLSLAITSKQKKVKILLGLLSLFFLIVLFMGIGRTGQVIAIIGIYVLTIKYSSNKAIIAILTTVIVITFMSIFYLVNENFKIRINDAKSDLQQLTHNNFCTSIGGRIATWDISYDIIKDHPMIGIGTIDHSDYLKNKIAHNKQYANCPIINGMDYYHCQYLEIATQFGIVGLMVFLSIFFFLAKTKTEDPIINNLNLILLITILLFFIVDMPFRRQFAIALFALISGLIIRQKIIEDEI